MNLRLSIPAAATLALSAALAQAAPIALFNTGVDAGGNVVAHGTVGDAHYTLVSVTSSGGASLAVPTIKAATQGGEGFPIPPWVGDNSTSRWIGPNTNDLEGVAGAVYKYRTTFDLGSADPLTAFISGRWATDDQGYMLLNGVAVGTNSTDYSSWANFSIGSGFIAGVNTLDFIVTNTFGGPTGLRVEMTGNVPEPSALALVGIALLGAGLARRRRT